MPKVLRDFLAPELRAISARLDAVDSRLAAQEKLTEARHNEILARIEGRKTSFELDRRIERLETKQPRT